MSALAIAIVSLVLMALLPVFAHNYVKYSGCSYTQLDQTSNCQKDSSQSISGNNFSDCVTATMGLDQQRLSVGQVIFL